VIGDSPTITVPAIGPWQDALVTDIRVETPRVKTYALRLPEPTPYVAGQHFLVRLTAPDGYTAQRTYSVASPPGDGVAIELTVERFPDGEVSSFLHDELQVGDTLEVRGPIGGWFVWDATSPALLIGGGSGIVPLMAMLRLARRTPDQNVAHLVVSARTPDDLIYRAELGGKDTTVLYTRESDGSRAAGRIATADIRPLVHPGVTVYICGSAAFAESATERTMDAGVDQQSIRVERFGPTG
jgi:ferredoxin-NADP reductase